MYTVLIGLAIFLSFLMVLVVLAQNSKGGGLTSQFGGSSASNLIGVKKTGDLLEKLTWGFAVAIMVCVLSTTFFDPRVAGDNNPIFQKAGEQKSDPAVEFNRSTTPQPSDSTK